MTAHNYVIGAIITFVVRFLIELFGEFSDGMDTEEYFGTIAYMAFGSMLWVLTIPYFILAKILYLANNYKWRKK